MKQVYVDSKRVLLIVTMQALAVSPPSISVEIIHIKYAREPCNRSPFSVPTPHITLHTLQGEGLSMAPNYALSSRQFTETQKQYGPVLNRSTKPKFD